ncbi:hypothetical protein Cme02nite_61260 [Catellatospora methionotrophica]|uniref:Uncharacterized protein n=1 Tax=Catellatospora methionotrophica TaxID=121620 RepID=A0A8J3PIJ0_9ACTN|nr:hypothetical protein [Catellatospora methionotrophica]GIG17794.1 hypothetical protein Cme02nite_61260 [Catellatospora methionotrophica]
METAHDVLIALTRRYAFAEVAALVAPDSGVLPRAGGGALTTESVAHVQQLCAFGQRLLDLDAEDFGELNAAAEANTEHGVADQVHGDHVPEHLRERALACRMPQAPKEVHRGALGSLRPTFRLLLEVIDARFRRGETTALVAAVHIASEYGPLLVWERVLGHAADPVRLPSAVGGDGSAWGDFEDRDCPHTKPEKSAARRSLIVAHENNAGWRTYLDRQHSNTSHALCVCATTCHRRCTVYRRLDARQAEVVTHGCRLTAALNESAVVKLRHSAPVGHGFGVPSQRELLDAWGRTRASLAKHDPAIAEEDGYPLPGFATFVAVLAGEPMPPDTLLADTAIELAKALNP